MAILPLIPYDDPRLSRDCAPVGFPLTPAELALVQDLGDTLMAAPTGIGLAAPQVGVLKQLFALKIGPTPTIIINPLIIWESGNVETLHEGCLSFPGTGVDVTRPVAAKVTYRDEQGRIHDEELNGIKCRCFLHEIAHLRGETILNHVPKEERETVLKALNRRLRRHL